MLELAAVAGPEFETDVIREAGDFDAAALAAALDEAVASGMIEEVPGHRSPTASPTSSCAGRSTTG